MKKSHDLLYPGIPPLKQAHPTQCSPEKPKMSLHFKNVHLGFGSLRIWFQSSKRMSKACVAHKPWCMYARKQGIRPAVTLMCKLKPVWRETPQLPCQTHRTAGQPSLAAMPYEISLRRPATCPGPPKPWIYPAWTKTHRAGCMPKRRVLWVYCVLAYISRQNILHLASNAKLFQLWENSNSPRSKYSFNFLCLEMIPRICSEWRQMKNATC